LDLEKYIDNIDLLTAGFREVNTMRRSRLAICSDVEALVESRACLESALGLRSNKEIYELYRFAVRSNAQGHSAVRDMLIQTLNMPDRAVISSGISAWIAENTARGADRDQVCRAVTALFDAAELEKGVRKELSIG
jgi:hypothetical protein